MSRQTPTQTVLDDIARERQRQFDAWPREHDDHHRHGELAVAAAELAVHGTDARIVDPGVLDEPDAWRLIAKHRDNRRRQLVIAAALLAAEIERLDRGAR